MSIAPHPRPFRILGLQQIALGALSKDRLKTLWVDLLGLQLKGQFESARENVLEDICQLGFGVALVEVDLMQPLDPEKKPQVHLPALNHIGLWVDDLPACVRWLTEQGVRFAPGGIRQGAAGFDICFIHPKGNEEFALSGEGVLIELVQAPSEVIAALSGALDAPHLVDV
ncbi:MAG: VOC family protein [Burkholderiaceae bacterium]